MAQQERSRAWSTDEAAAGWRGNRARLEGRGNFWGGKNKSGSLSSPIVTGIILLCQAALQAGLSSLVHGAVVT